MSTPLENLEAKIAQLEAAAAACIKATREAHAATKELRLAEKAVRDLLERDAPKMVSDAIDGAVEKGLAEYAVTLKAAMNKSSQKVMDEIHKLGDAVLTGNGTGPSLMDIALAEQADIDRIFKPRKRNGGSS